MKFNVHGWTGQSWRYLFTVACKSESEAIAIAQFRHGLNYRFEAYPHLDNFPEVVR